MSPEQRVEPRSSEDLSVIVVGGGIGENARARAVFIERLVRNALWRGRTPERFYDALEWLYGWKAESCLSD